MKTSDKIAKTLQEDKEAKELTMAASANGYDIDWSKLYPILNKYQSTVNCEEYHKLFLGMIKEIRQVHQYSLDDAVLVLKDLMYQAYLELKKAEKK